MSFGIGFGAAVKTALGTYRQLEEEKRLQAEEAFRNEERQRVRDERADVDRIATGLQDVETRQNTPAGMVAGPTGPVAFPKPEPIGLPSGPVGAPKPESKAQTEARGIKERDAVLRSAKTQAGMRFASDWRTSKLQELQLNQAARAEDFMGVVAARSNPSQMYEAASNFVAKHLDGFRLNVDAVGANGEQGATLISPKGEVVAVSTNTSELLLGLSAMLSPQAAMNVLMWDMEAPDRALDRRSKTALVTKQEAEAKVAPELAGLSVAAAKANIAQSYAAAEASRAAAARYRMGEPGDSAKARLAALQATYTQMAASPDPEVASRGRAGLMQIGSDKAEKWEPTGEVWRNPNGKDGQDIHTNGALGGRWIMGPDDRWMPLEFGTQAWRAKAIKDKDNITLMPLFSNPGETGPNDLGGTFMGWISADVASRAMKASGGKLPAKWDGRQMYGQTIDQALTQHVGLVGATPAPSPQALVRGAGKYTREGMVPDYKPGGKPPAQGIPLRQR